MSIGHWTTDIAMSAATVPAGDAKIVTAGGTAENNLRRRQLQFVCIPKLPTGSLDGFCCG